MEKQNDQTEAEIWVSCKFISNDGTVEEYPNYEVSNLGRVKSLNYHRTGKPKVLKPCRIVKLHGTYFQVQLCKDKKPYWKLVHRLVLSSFNSKGYFKDAVIDHIDSNPSNNRLSNLHWTTQQENTSTSHCKEALSKIFTNRADLSKQVKVTFLDDGHCEVFLSAHETSRALGIPLCTVSYHITLYKGYYKKLNLLFEYI